MTDSQRARARRVKDAIAAIGLTPAEASLLHVIHYGITVPPDDLSRYAASRSYSVGGQSSLEDCWGALANGIEKGWFQVVDEVILAKIQ